MSDTFQSGDEARSWQQRHEPQAPKVGQMAPDFTLCDVHGEDPVRPADFRGKKPVALIFGSFT